MISGVKDLESRTDGRGRHVSRSIAWSWLLPWGDDPHEAEIKLGYLEEVKVVARSALHADEMVGIFIYLRNK